MGETGVQAAKSIKWLLGRGKKMSPLRHLFSFSSIIQTETLGFEEPIKSAFCN